MTHRTNQRPAKCPTCRAAVDAGAGTLVNENGAWKVFCQACLPFPVKVAPTVRVRLFSTDTIEIAPADRLGSEWAAFKAILDRNGARAKKIGDIWSNRCAIGAAAGLIADLAAGGFQLEVDDKVRAAIAQVGAAAQVDVDAANERMAQVDAELAKRGKSLRPYQREGVAWMAARTGALLGDDMGLGKSIQALSSVPAGAPVLVIGPAVAKGVWARESGAWRPELRVSKLAGRKSFRWPAPGELVAINYDILPPGEINVPRAAEPDDDCDTCNCAKRMHDAGRACPAFVQKSADATQKAPAPFLKDCPAGLVVIVDEAHMVKNPKAARSISVRAITRAAREGGGRSYLLTGTPLLNTPPELWHVLACAGLDKEAFPGGWFAFARAMGGTQDEIKVRGGKTQKIWKWGGRPTAAAGDALKRVMLRRMKDDVLADLPPKTYKTIDVELADAELQAEMDEAWGDYGDELGAIIDGEPPSVPFNQISELRARIAKAKIPAMLEVVEQYEEAQEPLVVFSAHRAPVEELAAREGWAVIMGGTSPEERTRIENAFQAGKLRGVACTIKAGGVAITLTRSAHMLVVDREWTPALNAQAEDRCRRIGQERPVFITDLVCAHQLDRQVNELLLAKQNLINASVERARVKGDEAVRNAAQAAAEALLAIDAPRPTGAIDFARKAEEARLERLAKLLEQLAAEDAAERARREEAERPLTREERFERTVARAAAKQRELDGDASLRKAANAVEAWAEAGIQQLAAMDSDYASEENGVGFSKDCVGVGHALARSLQTMFGLTDRGWDLCVAVCTRFKGQIGAPPARGEAA